MQIRTLLPFVAALVLCVGTAGATCNPSYVHQTANVITILPTGSDDTINLQCAFDLSSTISGVVLQFAKGTYITGRILVNGFSGTVRGMGMDATIIRNADYPIYVTPDDFYLTPPETGGQVPSLFVFLGGDYIVTGLTVSIVGEEPATDWSIFGIREVLGHGIKSLAGAFYVLGAPTGTGHREANASFYRVKVTGQSTQDPLFGVNLYNGTFFEGFAGPELVPLKGTFSVSDSVFDTVGSPLPSFNLVDSRVRILGNTFSNVIWGGEIVDLKNTVYEFAHNQMSGVMGVQNYENCLGAESNCGMSSSDLIIKNNVFRSTYGVLMDAAFVGNDTKALVLGNNFAHVTDLAVSLGPKTSHCTVVGVGSGTALNLGTDNSVTGMTKGIGTQGQRIKTLLEIAKDH